MKLKTTKCYMNGNYKKFPPHHLQILNDQVSYNLVLFNNGQIPIAAWKSM